MRKNAEEYSMRMGVGGSVEFARERWTKQRHSRFMPERPSTPSVLHGAATRENSTHIIFVLTSFYFLTIFVFILSLISSFFYVSV
jgi:hypothetical protein